MSILKNNSFSINELKEIFDFLDSRLMFVNLYCSDEFIKFYIRFLDSLRLELKSKKIVK